MAITCPTAIRRREDLIRRRRGRDPSGIKVFYLKNQERRKSLPRGRYALYRRYPLLPAVYYFPTYFLAYIYEFTRCLTRSYAKPRLVHIIDVFRSVVVRDKHLGDRGKPPLYSLEVYCLMPCAINLSSLNSFYFGVSRTESREPFTANRGVIRPRGRQEGKAALANLFRHFEDKGGRGGVSGTSKASYPS